MHPNMGYPAICMNESEPIHTYEMGHFTKVEQINTNSAWQLMVYDQLLQRLDESTSQITVHPHAIPS